jgi:signal transduction histidine kinase/CheY-like chemotaxis protein
MNSSRFKKWVDIIRYNGVKPTHTAIEARLISVFNSIWASTYITLFIFSCIIILLLQYVEQIFVFSTLILHVLFWIVRLLIKKGSHHIAKHLFLCTTYVMLIFYDDYFGKQSLTQIYFIAFLPTVLSLFSVKDNKVSIILYTVSPLIILLLSESFTVKWYPLNNSPVLLVQFVRYYNIVMSFSLAVIYSIYIVYVNVLKQSKLLKQKISLQTTLDNAVGAIWSIDKNYNLITLNKQFAEFATATFSVQNLKAGFNIKSFIYDEAYVEVWTQFYEKVFLGESFTEVFKYKDQTFEFKAKPIIDNDCKIIGATFNSRDITRKVDSEKILIEAKQNAEVASEARSRFLSNMSHEIRTPLNGIVGLSNIMLDENHLVEQKKNLETLQELSEHTLQLVNNILDFSKLDAGKTKLDKAPFSLKQLVTQMDSMFSLAAKQKKLELTIEANIVDDVYVKGDAVRLSQVLINLLSNAIKFTEKGNVNLSVMYTDLPESNQCEIKFAVIDTGIGIKNRHIAKIFESFTQADVETTRKFGGTGLGISISDKILQLMNSKLLVDSELNKGSTFYFTVILDKAIKKELNSNQISVGGVIDEKLDIKVLIAEDNMINQKVAKQIIQKWGVTVSVVDNGEQAVNFFKTDMVDIILMDLDMPIMDGYEATALIKHQYPDLPIIALTAASFDDMENFLIKKGFDDVVQKPFLPKTLYFKLVEYKDGVKA